MRWVPSSSGSDYLHRSGAPASRVGRTSPKPLARSSAPLALAGHHQCIAGWAVRNVDNGGVVLEPGRRLWLGLPAKYPANATHDPFFRVSSEIAKDHANDPAEDECWHRLPEERVHERGKRVGGVSDEIHGANHVPQQFALRWARLYFKCEGNYSGRPALSRPTNSRTIFCVTVPRSGRSRSSGTERASARNANSKSESQRIWLSTLASVSRERSQPIR